MSSVGTVPDDGFSESIILAICCCFVFLMQVGFLLLEVGLVRSKNASSIILKNLIDLFSATLGFSLIGYAILTGTSGNSFIGIAKDHVALNNLTLYESFFFNVVFVATCSTIVSGAIAERGSFILYFFIVLLLAVFLYPVVGYWIWNPEGWLYKLGFVDLAGSLVVHGVGGTAALIAIIICGPRLGRFNDITNQLNSTNLKRGKYNKMPGHSIPLFVIGCFILWVGFFPFNIASFMYSFSALPDRTSLLGKVIVNTFLSSSFAGTIAFLFDIAKNRHVKGVSVVRVFSAVLTGCVAICAGCAHVPAYAAVVTGVAGGLIFILLDYLLIIFRIDDPVSAVPVHLGGAIVGTISPGLFANSIAKGAFYGNPKLLGIQIAGLVTVICWTCLFMVPLCLLTKYFKVIRVNEEVEEKGYDQYLKTEPCYPETYAHGDYLKFKAFLDQSEYIGDFRKVKQQFSDNKNREGTRSYHGNNNSKGDSRVSSKGVETVANGDVIVVDRMTGNCSV
eukprot:Pgem_evm1s13819